MTRLALALAFAFGAVLLAAPGRAHAAPVEVRAARGLDGVVAAGGIDVAVVEVRSGADVPLAGEVEVAGRRHAIELPARGVAAVTVAARLPTGASLLTAVPVRVVVGGEPLTAELPAARVVARPVVVVSDQPAEVLAAIEPWRRAQRLGEPVVLAPGRLPAAWSSLVGAGALVTDRPASELAPAVARAARRLLAAGGTVCRAGEGDAAPVCVQAALLATPRTPVRATLAPLLGGWARLALVLAIALALAALLRRWRGVAVLVLVAAGVVAPVVASVRKPDSALAVQGVRADAGDGEHWVAAELGVSDLGGATGLAGDLWIEASGADGGGPLDDVGLGGRLPRAGSWRVRGFVPAGDSAGAGWAARLTFSPRALPELP